jgi:hypothetical protein
MIIDPYIGTSFSSQSYIFLVGGSYSMAIFILILFGFYIKKANPKLTYPQACVAGFLYYITEFLPRFMKGQLDVIGEVIGDISYVFKRIIYILKGEQWKYDDKKAEASDPLEEFNKYIAADHPARGFGRIWAHFMLLFAPSSSFMKILRFSRLPVIGKLGSFLPRIGISAQKTITIIRSHGIRIYIENASKLISILKNYPGVLYEVVKFRSLIVALLEKFTDALSAVARKLQKDIKIQSFYWQSRSRNLRPSDVRFSSVNYESSSRLRIIRRVSSTAQNIVQIVAHIVPGAFRTTTRAASRIIGSARGILSRIASTFLGKIIRKQQAPSQQSRPISYRSRGISFSSSRKSFTGINTRSFSGYKSYSFIPRASARKF